MELADPERDRPLSEVRTMCDTETLLSLVAACLRSIHDLAAEGCPFERSTARLVEQARRRVGEGEVDPTDFDEAYRRFDATQLLDFVDQTAPRFVDHPGAVIGGDVSMADLWIGEDGDRVLLGRCARFGVGDPYRDLATVSIDLVGEGASPDVLGLFYEQYGLPRPDVARVDFHVLLDQLLR